MQPLLVRTADVPARSWQNGGGVTRELLALPAADAWRVRVSVAEVDADGPFSVFDGVERWFAVLAGNGVVLTVGSSEHRCTPDDDAFVFDGTATTACRLIDGPTRDLNLMLRGVHGAMARVVSGAAWQPRARECGLYATAAGTVEADGGAAREAIPADALRWWADAPASLAFDGAGWWLRADTGAAA